MMKMRMKLFYGDAVSLAWFKRKERLEHAYTVTAWALSVHPEICADCAERMSTDKGDSRKLIDEVVALLDTHPCLNKKVPTLSIDEIIDIFWKEFKHFINRSGSFQK